MLEETNSNVFQVGMNNQNGILITEHLPSPDRTKTAAGEARTLQIPAIKTKISDS